MVDNSQSDAIKRRNTAAFLAIAKDATLEVTYRSGECKIEGAQVNLTPPTYQPSEEKLSEFRGSSDKLAVTHCHHNAELHQKLRPHISDKTSLLFDALEDARTEIIGSSYMDGVKKNLVHHHDRIYRQLGYERFDVHSDQVQQALLQAHITHKFANFSIPPTLEAAYRHEKEKLEEQLKDYEELLEKNIDNQKAFAEIVGQYLRDLYPSDMPAEDDAVIDDTQDQEAANEEGNQEQNQNQQASQEQSDDSLEVEDGESDGYEETEGDESQIDDIETVTSPKDGEDIEKPRPEHDLSSIDTRIFYHIYTNQYDEIIHAEDLVQNEEEKVKLRQKNG